MRILHSPVNIANQPWGLSRQERKLGHKSDVAVNYATWLGYPNDICLGEYQKKTNSLIAKRAIFGLAAPFLYNVLHYYFGRSLLCWDDYGPRNSLWFKDLKLGKILGRKVFHTLQGCDVRIAGESDRKNKITMCREGYCNNYKSCIDFYDKQRKELINEIIPLCHKTFYLNPELGHFVPGATFLPYACVDVESVSPRPPRTNGRIKILHAPSDGSIKGTHWVIKAIDNLRDKFPIDFKLIQNMPYEEAMKEYFDSDLVIDQLLAGWYGAFAVELMAMGKPVFCYIRKQDLGFIPPQMKEELPLINADSNNIEQRLCEIIEQREKWLEWSDKSMKFVHRWHNPKFIAQAMIEAYESKDSYFNLAEHVK